MAVAAVLWAGCSSDDAIADNDAVDSSRDEASANAGCSKSTIAIKWLSDDEIEALGLLSVAIDDEHLNDAILPQRRMTVDLRNQSSVTVDLLSPANIWWNYAPNEDMRVALKDNTFLMGRNWIYNYSMVDYGPFFVESLSPTQVKIVRKTGDWSDRKPIEIKLERLIQDYMPLVPGVHATLVVEVSDTPADSRDTEYTRFISMEQADALELFHMSFDCEAYRAPLFESGDVCTVQMPENESEVVIALASPAKIFDLEGVQSAVPADKTAYYDADALEWVFYPMTGARGDIVTMRMDDPLHVVINVEGLRRSDVDSFEVFIERSDRMNAPDAGTVSGIIRIVK